MRYRCAWFWTFALVLLASLGALVAQDAFAHTDDGCAVEIHCLACRWAFNTSNGPSAPPAPLPWLLAADSTQAPAAVPIADAVAAATLSRGPPSLS